MVGIYIYWVFTANGGEIGDLNFHVSVDCIHDIIDSKYSRLV